MKYYSANLMKKVKINGVELEYSLEGSAGGEFIVLVHGSVFEDMFLPMISDPTLSKYTFLHYHRRGYGGSTLNSETPSINQQSKDCLELMYFLNIDNAHIVSHSYAGLIALQAAVDQPERVRSLTLMEPPLAGFVPSGEEFGKRLSTSVGFYQQGRKFEALDSFLKVVFEGTQDYRKVIDTNLGNKAFERALFSIDTMFKVEYPALLSWKFNPDNAKSLSMPILSIEGTDSASFFKQIHALLESWFPHLETTLIQNTSHILHMQYPKSVANGLSTFLSNVTKISS
jgi:pimeloyl-ACP methyl ester carboxylesterase